MVLDDEDFPDKFVRGIPQTVEYINNEFPTAKLFHGANTKYGKPEVSEISINWYDCEKAFDIVMNMKKSNGSQIKHKAGVAIFLKSELDRVCEKPVLERSVSYERFPIGGNDFHGNILFYDRGFDKTMMSMVHSFLADCCISSKPIVSYDEYIDD
jgi:hypothetical protein